MRFAIGTTLFLFLPLIYLWGQLEPPAAGGGSGFMPLCVYVYAWILP